MKKFGFGKKGSPAPASDNPYQQPGGQDDPYANMTPYQQAKAGLPSGPRMAGPPGGLPSGPGANRYGAPPPQQQAPPPQPSGGYGAEKYGASGGYGSNRYGDDGGYGGAPRAGARGPGGYGGLGRTESYGTEKTLVNDDDARDNLFGGAKARYQKQQQNQQPGDAPPPYGEAPPQRSYGGGNADRYGGGGYGDAGRDELFSGAGERAAQRQQSSRSGAYGERAPSAYGEDRELTAEEQEELEINDTKAQIAQVKGESVQSTRRAVQAGEAAMESSRAIMARLGAQGERLHNTEKNLDLSANHNKVAQDKTKELKTLNRSMFAVHVNNPFGAKARQEKHEQALLDRHHSERDARERTRQDAYATNQRMEGAFKDVTSSDRPQFQRNLASRSKYQFEADDDDDELEDEIEGSMGQLEHITGRLHQASLAIGQEIDHRNKLIDRIGQKSDRVDDDVRLNRDRLARIR